MAIHSAGTVNALNSQELSAGLDFILFYVLLFNQERNHTEIIISFTTDQEGRTQKTMNNTDKIEDNSDN